jgi:hypothetical protein
MKMMALWLPAGLVLFLAQDLQAQGVRTPRPLPPEIGAPGITVTGINGKSVSMSAANLAKLPMQSVKASVRGTTAAFQGVPLSDVLSKVATPSGDQFRGTVASYYVVVQGADGYRAVLSWAEVDPTFTDRKVWLVTARDGKPLTEKDGPFMTMVPDDKRQSRWVHQVVEVSIQKVD